MYIQHVPRFDIKSEYCLKVICGTEKMLLSHMDDMNEERDRNSYTTYSILYGKQTVLSDISHNKRKRKGEIQNES